MFCYKCGNEIPNDTTFCPICNSELSRVHDKITNTKKSSALKKYIVTGLVCLFAGFISVQIIRRIVYSGTSINEEQQDHRTDTDVLNDKIQIDLRNDILKTYREWSYSKQGDKSLSGFGLFNKKGDPVYYYGYMDNKPYYKEYKYDSTGRIVEEVNIQGDIRNATYSVTAYNSKGNRVSKVKYLGDGSIDHEYESKYNEETGELTEFFYNQDGLLSRSEKYSKDGIIIASENYRDGVLERRTDCNNDGNIVKSQWYEENGTPSGQETYVYDSEGNMISSETLWDDGSLSFYVERDYDSANNLIAERTYNADGSLSSLEEFKYDEYDNMTSKKYTRDGETTTFFENNYQYDDKGLIIREEYKSRDESYVREFSRNFDENDNIISETESKDGMMVKTVEYEYYTFDELSAPGMISTLHPISEEEMKDLIGKSEELYAWTYDDFDGDGSYEAYTLTLDDYDEVTTIWFVNDRGMIFTTEPENVGFYYESDEGNHKNYKGREFFYADCGEGGLEWWTILCSVNKGIPYVLSLSEKIRGFYEENGYIYTTQGEFSDTEGFFYKNVKLDYDDTINQFLLTN